MNHVDDYNEGLRYSEDDEAEAGEYDDLEKQSDRTLAGADGRKRPLNVIVHPRSYKTTKLNQVIRLKKPPRNLVKAITLERKRGYFAKPREDLREQHVVPHGNTPIARDREALR